MQRSSARVWLSPAAAASPGCWKEALQTPEGLLDLVLEDAYAYLEALERRKGSLLLEAPIFFALGGGPRAASGGGRREGPVRLSLDLAGFAPEDVSVQLEGRKVRVTAKRESQRRAPDGCCARDYREVWREVLLPDEADAGAVSCALGADGQLRIEAPRLPPPPPPERVIPIRRLQAEEEAVGQGDQARDGREEKQQQQQPAEKK